ncbi:MULTISPECIES: type III secretion system chaperone [unclassified Rhizobacter]|uniref:type III secretion system chaperone n=1 Tax=unclassified Rhizobacter TaxID=2640088 RepID=UPI0007003F96|nr:MULTISPECIES: type III secretion system chaperone [unclassified Rhizobacter]KQU73400.1 hypothetical protein ASC88_04080 [Rhizobacter sp. Root29]KQV98585.1 hypothetical protein ASC98_07910 [Rhizobacter sp. Root1238]KRB04838.1 hypothetical protein ASE08_13065 [Rhizobacter sp. Root16D2]
MSNILKNLADGFARRVDGAHFEFDGEGHLQLVADGKYVVSLLHEPDESRIHLFADAGTMPFGLEHLRDHLPERHGEGHWHASTDRTDLTDAEGFTSALRWHESTGSVLQLASAPVAQLDDAKFANWLKRFLDDLTRLAAMIAAGPDVENAEVIEVSEFPSMDPLELELQLML